MISLSKWTWVSANSRRWWRTGKPGELQFMGLQRVGHDLETEQQHLSSTSTAWFPIVEWIWTHTCRLHCIFEPHEVRNPWYLTYFCNSNSKPRTSCLEDTHICWMKSCVSFCSLFYVRKPNCCVILMGIPNLFSPCSFVYIEINFNLLSDSNFSLTQA